MNFNEPYVQLVERLLQGILSGKREQAAQCFFSGVEPTFVDAVVDAIKPYEKHHWLQDGHGNDSAVVIMLLHGEKYAFCEFQLYMNGKAWRVHNVILRPLKELPSQIFLGDFYLEATEDFVDEMV